MRGGGPGEYTLYARELNHHQVGEVFTVDLDHGVEFMSRIDGIRWTRAGLVRVLLPVAVDRGGDHFIDLDRDTQLLFRDSDEASS